MSRPIMLDMILSQYKYHKFENVELIQRKEDDNIVLQGEHVVFVLKKYEALIWNQINEINTIEDIINKVYQDISKEFGEKKFEYNEFKLSIMDFLQKLMDEELIHEYGKL